MALPAGYNQAQFAAKFGGAPTDYQIDGYLASVSATTQQRSGLSAHIKAIHASVPSIDKIRDWLNNN